MTSTGRFWTVCLCLRIRRLGVRVPPSAPRSQAHCDLAGTLTAARRGLNDPQLAVRELQGLANPKLPRVQIDILPAQGEQLTAAQPGRERQDEEGLKSLAPDGAEQPRAVLDGQVWAAVPEQCF